MQATNVTHQQQKGSGDCLAAMSRDRNRRSFPRRRITCPGAREGSRSASELLSNGDDAPATTRERARDETTASPRVGRCFARKGGGQEASPSDDDPSATSPSLWPWSGSSVSVSSVSGVGARACRRRRGQCTMITAVPRSAGRRLASRRRPRETKRKDLPRTVDRSTMMTASSLARPRVPWSRSFAFWTVFLALFLSRHHK